jgi:hypothetical protein
MWHRRLLAFPDRSSHSFNGQRSISRSPTARLDYVRAAEIGRYIRSRILNLVRT